MSTNDLHSRRQFFKKSMQMSLPILAGLALPRLLTSCDEPILGGCKDCEKGCSGSCDSSCKARCSDNCSGYCGTSCMMHCSQGSYK